MNTYLHMRSMEDKVVAELKALVADETLTREEKTTSVLHGLRGDY